MEYRIIYGLLNDIDDRLGILDYNLVVEGRITGASELPSTVSWYFFKPTQGPEFEIFIGASTIMPVGNYDDIINQDMRIFASVSRREGEQGELFRAVRKIELLKDDPSINIQP